jgi:hypothetical protein
VEPQVKKEKKEEKWGGNRCRNKERKRKREQAAVREAWGRHEGGVRHEGGGGWGWGRREDEGEGGLWRNKIGRDSLKPKLVFGKHDF